MRGSKIKVWQLTPEQVANYVPGMDLGRPDRFEEPPPSTLKIMDEDGDERRRRAVRNRLNGKIVLTEELYKRHRGQFMTDREIAERYEITPKTLTGYKSVWRKKRHG
ncbi:hypothetical protein [Paenibacillus gorillae]|uniref:hypothetical protein n=1 Tax=Paenibacillus gorillae TaxID=1243662 RepID=UPI0004AD1A56|nr:hypothetical protein [Paenibacillus gorillae]